MKTAEEHAINLLKIIGCDPTHEQVKSESPEQWEKMECWIKQIQLDAMKEGMRRAAAIIEVIEPSSPARRKYNILTAAEQLTIEQL